MWDCKRLWLLFIALLYLKDVRALGVWNKRPAQDWYSVAAQIPLAQPKEPAPLPDGAQTSTAMRDEGLQSQNIVSYAQATSNQDVSTAALQNNYGTPSVTLQSGNTVSSSMYQQRPLVPNTSQTSQSWMQNASSFSGSQSQTSNGYGLSQGFASQYVDHSSAIPAFIVTQPGSAGKVFSGSTSSLSSVSQSPSAYWQSPSSLFSQYLGSQGQQGINQMSSAPGLTVIQPASDSAVYNDSATSMPASYTSSQSPSIYWQSPSSLFTQYLGSQGQLNVNQVSSASGLTTTQQAAPSIVSSGSTSSTSSSSSGSQSPSVHWQSPSSQSQSSTGHGLSQRLASRYGGFWMWPDQNQLSSAPALTLTQQVAESGMSSIPTTSGMSSIAYSGFQSPSISWLSGISKPTSSTPTQQGINQHGSVPRLTVIQPSTVIASSNGSTSSTSSSYSSPSSTSSGQSLSSLGSPGQQSVNQMSSAPGLTMTQQSTPSVVSSDSTSSSYTGSQSQPSTGYGVSQWLSNQYGKFQTQQGINKVSSAPGLTVTQQSMTDVASSGSASSTSSSSSGSQSPSTYWHSLSSPFTQYLESQGQQSVNQMSSASGLTVAQQSTPSVVSSGSTSSSYTGSQSQHSTGYGTFQVLASQHGGFQTLQGTNQMNSAPSLTLIPLASDTAVTNGSIVGTLSSYSGSQSQGSAGYGLSQGLPSQPGRLQMQQGINQINSAPGLTTTQQATPSIVSSGSTSSTSSSSSGSQSPSIYWPSQSSGINQMSSAPGLTVIQPASDSAMFNDSTVSTSSSHGGSQSQGSTVYGLSQGLASRYGKFQMQQGINQLSSAPGLTVTRQSMPNVASSGSASSTSSSSSGSQSPSTNWQSASSLFTQYLGSQGPQSVNQMSSIPGSTVIQPASPSVVSSGSTSSSYTGSQSQPSTGYWVSQWLANQHGKIQTQQSVNQMSSVPGSTVTQQSMPNVDSSGSTSSASSSYMPSQSQTSSGYGLSQWLVSRNGSFEMWPEQNQLHSAPASTMTQQVVERGMSSGSTTSGISSTGSQSPSTSWLSGIFKPTHGTPTQQGINQLVSVPGLTGIKPASVSNGSTVSASGSYGVAHIQSPSAYWQSPSSLSSQYLGSQGQQSVNQLSSAPGLTVTQQAAPSVVSSGTSTSSSPIGFQSQSTSGYWSSQGLSNHHDGLQTQGTQPLNQQASSTLTSSGPNVNSTTTSNLGIQSMNVPKPQAFNLWMGRYSCKSGSSSNASMLS
ncbi:A-agglutinin anchorage subunit [Tachysurus fulvidraco]|uniref:A-agglutinin anchorage subunit n=1 Tax=Tachysurus fulvidraco TaxID=1234273 RepID=UPI001FEFA74D|nr:A-agglutinin anchorage subunit [Tachysurus fulvidraco]